MVQLVDDFITKEKAEEILSSLSLSSLRSKPSDHPNELGDYHISSGIPEMFSSILESLLEKGYFIEKPDAITINEYLPNQSIEPHIDDITYGEKIAVITLLGSSDILFAKGDVKMGIPLKPYSLIYWDGLHRWEATHEIPPVSERRVSLVIRKQLC